MKVINKDIVLNIKKIFGSKNYLKWLEAYPILSNKDIISWLQDKISKYTDSGKQAAEFSITTYIKPLQQYCNYNKVSNPSNLLKEEIDERNLRVKAYLDFLLNGDEIEIIALGFRNRPSDVSIRNQLQSRIKSFYSARGKNISYGMKTAKSGANIRKIILTKSMIKVIREKLESPEYRLIVKIMSQTGLRISDVLETLNKCQIEKFADHYYIKNLRTKKLGVVINYVFFTEELSNLLQTISGEKVPTELNLNKLLLTNRGTPIKKVDFVHRLRQAAQDAGIDGIVGSHSFRKYFSSQVRKCKQIDDEFKEHLMGHTSFNLSQAYNNNLKDIEWYYEQWLLTEQLICVDCIIYDKTNEEIAKLKVELAKKNNVIDSLAKRQAAIELELQDFRDGKKFMEQLMEKIKKEKKSSETEPKKSISEKK